MSKIDVSIIIPIYNCEKYLKECIESILMQTLKKIEVILIDDGSTDNSLKICKLFQSKDPRIKVIHQENVGVSKARENGLKIATGKYISFIDADDYIKEDFLEKLYNEIRENKTD